MKNILKLAISLSFIFTKGQELSYLHIELSNTIENSVSYPPKTNFQLFDQDGNYVLADGELDEPFDIGSRHTLLVYPTYKDKTDTLVIDSGRISMKMGHDNYEISENIDTKMVTDFNKITARKELFESKKTGEQNLILTFENGLVFLYLDGKAKALFQNQEVPIQGKYVVDFDGGTAKISYNPRNGETWWIFGL